MRLLHLVIVLGCLTVACEGFFGKWFQSMKNHHHEQKDSSEESQSRSSASEESGSDSKEQVVDLETLVKVFKEKKEDITGAVKDVCQDLKSLPPGNSQDAQDTVRDFVEDLQDIIKGKSDSDSGDEDDNDDDSFGDEDDDWCDDKIKALLKPINNTCSSLQPLSELFSGKNLIQKLKGLLELHYTSQCIRDKAICDDGKKEKESVESLVKSCTKKGKDSVKKIVNGGLKEGFKNVKGFLRGLKIGI